MAARLAGWTARDHTNAVPNLRPPDRVDALLARSAVSKDAELLVLRQVAGLWWPSAPGTGEGRARMSPPRPEPARVSHESGCCVAANPP